MNGNEAAAEATVPAPVELQAVCDVTSMAVHPAGFAWLCSFCVCVSIQLSGRAARKRRDTHTPEPVRVKLFRAGLKTSQVLVELKSQNCRNEV